MTVKQRFMGQQAVAQNWAKLEEDRLSKICVSSEQAMNKKEISHTLLERVQMVLFGNMKVPLGKTRETGPTTIAMEKKGNGKLA